ncbi:MAG: TatD family hydrolase [Candidatus Omnitrophica bacterium]|nr:TatD family hydrolase [Candidatus Omnitrophota bacterium]
MKRIIDTHAHLNHTENLDFVLREAVRENVEAVLAVSEDLVSSRESLEIKKRYSAPEIYVACGIHPSKSEEAQVEECVGLIKENKNDISVIGEIGLDYWYNWVKRDKDKKEQQKQIFVRLLDLARELDLPVSVHSRGAWRDCLDLIKASGVKRGVFHWYSGPLDVLKEILDAGYFISATPALAYSPQSQEAVKYSPVEQTIIETDSPVFYKGQGEEASFSAQPKDVWKTLRLFCAIKNIEEGQALRQLNDNAVNLFNFYKKGE